MAIFDISRELLEVLKIVLELNIIFNSYMIRSFQAISRSVSRPVGQSISHLISHSISQSISLFSLLVIKYSVSQLVLFDE